MRTDTLQLFSVLPLAELVDIAAGSPPRGEAASAPRGWREPSQAAERTGPREGEPARVECAPA